jgi:hypothetical protein
MTNDPYEHSGDSTKRAAHRNHQHGVGWQLWRRTQATALLPTPIRMDIAHLHPGSLMNPVPLADEIRQRWGLGRATTGYRFHPNLPLFYG